MNDNELLQAITTAVSTAIKPVETRLDGIDTTLDGVDTTLDAINTRLDTIEADTKDIRLTLENETNRNITLIAEGHLDLSRKLDDALKVESQKELLMIRVNVLENELRRLKDRIEIIA